MKFVEIIIPQFVQKESPSSRRAWIEMPSGRAKWIDTLVALLAEGVD